MSKNSQHVISNPSGGWIVKTTGSERASKHFNTQAEAVEWARQKAKDKMTELYIHSKDGRVSEKNNYSKR